MKTTMVNFLFVAIATLAVECGKVPTFRCQCRGVAPDNANTIKIPDKVVKEIVRIPAGPPHCSREEVVIYFMGGRKLCVNPKAAWVKNLEKNVQRRTATKTPTDTFNIVSNPTPGNTTNGNSTTGYSIFPTTTVPTWIN